MPEIRVLTGSDLFEGAAGDWRALAHDSLDATPFQTFEWQSTWFRHYGVGKQPFGVAMYEGRDLVGLMPLTRSNGPWRVVRPMGIGPSDYLHPLARDGYEAAMAEAVVDTCRSVDLLDLHQVRERRVLAGTDCDLSIDQATCLLLDLPETYDAYLATLGKSLRYDVRKLDRTLLKDGRATIEQYGVDEVQAGMDVFFEQHRLRWRKRHQLGAFLGKAPRFHREWVEQAARAGWLWLSVLRLEGRPIGAIYAMSFGKTTFYYQAGFDPSEGAVSPGNVLVAHTIRRSIEEGKHHFDFMRGDEPYKRRWKPQHVLANRRLLIASSGLRGQLGRAWNGFGSRVEGRVRARLEGHAA